MPAANRKLRFSLKSLLVLMTMVAVLVSMIHNYWGYHLYAEEVELGTFHSISSPLGLNGPRYKCDCRIFLSTHWPDSVEHQVRRTQRELHSLVAEAIRAASHQELNSPTMGSLRTAIKDGINKKVGSNSRSGLVKNVIISEYSYHEAPEERLKRFYSGL